MKIESKRLIIRKLKMSDYKDYYNYAKCEDVAYSAGFKPVPDIETAKNIVTALVFKDETFAILLKENKKFIGTVSLNRFGMRKIDNVYTLGISLDKDYHSLGLGTETIKLMLDYAFNYLDVSYIEICHDINNLKSQKMIEKIGFKLFGYITDYKVNFDNTMLNVLFYSLNKEEYLKEKEKWQKF